MSLVLKFGVRFEIARYPWENSLGCWTTLNKLVAEGCGNFVSGVPMCVADLVYL